MDSKQGCAPSAPLCRSSAVRLSVAGPAPLTSQTCQKEERMPLMPRLWSAVLLAAALASPSKADATVAPSNLVGVWSLDGRQACKGGPAWVLFADGTYAEAMLPDLRPYALGRWHERDGSILYTRAQPAGSLPRNAPMHPLKIIERTPNRFVAATHDQVRRVMHYCGQPRQSAGQ